MMAVGLSRSVRYPFSEMETAIREAETSDPPETAAGLQPALIRSATKEKPVMDKIRFETLGALGILTLANPPLNLFSEELIEDLRAAVTAAMAGSAGTLRHLHDQLDRDDVDGCGDGPRA